jgi:hypothetical protein
MFELICGWKHPSYYDSSRMGGYFKLAKTITHGLEGIVLALILSVMLYILKLG